MHRRIRYSRLRSEGTIHSAESRFPQLPTTRFRVLTEAPPAIHEVNKRLVVIGEVFVVIYCIGYEIGDLNANSRSQAF